jgi:hypothetical protein
MCVFVLDRDWGKDEADMHVHKESEATFAIRYILTNLFRFEVNEESDV